MTRLGLSKSLPEFKEDWPLSLISLVPRNVFEILDDARQKAEARWSTLPPEEKNYLALLKASLICTTSRDRLADEVSNPSIGGSSRRFSICLKLMLWRRSCSTGLPENLIPSGATFRRTWQPATNQCFSSKLAVAVGKRPRHISGRPVAPCDTGRIVGSSSAIRQPVLRPKVIAITYRQLTCGTDLVHGRAEIDKRILGLTQSLVPDDLESSGRLGDEEPDNLDAIGPGGRGGGATEDAGVALEQWSTPLVSCTVDTVLGLVQNNRRGLYAWPSIAGSVCIFDEIHAYDERLFSALERFLRDLPGIPCLLMTASMPNDRLRRLEDAVRNRCELKVIPGPEQLETVPRYQRHPCTSVEEAWEQASQVLSDNGKVLWVVNTVDRAIEMSKDCRAALLGSSPLS